MRLGVFIMSLWCSTAVYAGSDTFFLISASSLGYSLRDMTVNRPNPRRDRIEAVKSSALIYLEEGTKTDALEDVIDECRIWLGAESATDEDIVLKILDENSELFQS